MRQCCIDPKKISPGKGDSSQERANGFLLLLAIAFNDIKAIINFFPRDLDSSNIARYSNSGFKSDPRKGEYYGYQLTFEKIIISMLYEYLLLIDRNGDFFNSKDGQTILGKMKKVNRDLLAKIRNPQQKKGERNWEKLFLKSVRNNAGFHFYDKNYKLRSAFKKHFDGSKTAQQEIAYFSIGRSMADTRYFYADGAVQAFLKDEYEGNNYDPKRLVEFLKKVNNVTADILKQFLKIRDME